MRPFSRLLLLGLAALALSSCSRPAPLFSEQNARAHVGMLAGTIGSRAIGTPENARARAYIVDQLQLFGFEVRVQETDARRPELGRTARVSNIIATLPGARPEAIGLVAHYDSSPFAPGATDDALGVAVALEAARVLAAKPEHPWTLMILLTDGEEADLMGAAALVTDREVTRRLQAYMQVESIGSSGTALLFEAGPGNGWLLNQWARSAPHPRGASHAIEIYRRLPNDTDFSILKREEIPGLNFAPVGDSYAYHTARDTPERLSPATIRRTGENVVAIVTALSAADITKRAAATATFFDVGEAFGIAYGPWTGRILVIIAVLAGVIAWVRITGAAMRIAGMLRWLMTFVWTAIGAALVVAAMIGATWALRVAREVYHPWYARPGRLMFLLVTIGIVVGWSVSRFGQWIPARAHGLRHPVMAWSVTLPVWLALACGATWFAPSAAYLWVVPLAAAGVLLALVPPLNGAAIRAASLVVFVVTAAVWARDTVDMFRFLVTTLGRLPLVTPVFVYAALIAASGVMLVPPLVGAFLAPNRLLRPSIWTAIALIGVSAAGGFAYAAPAYTFDQPLRRIVRAIQPADGGQSIWEVGSTEPGLDLTPGAPGGWTVASGAAPTGIPWGRLRAPFVFRTSGAPLGPPPAEISESSVQPVAGGVELTVSVLPKQPGLAVTFLFPPGVTPARANLPGVERSGSWTATYAAVPPDGVMLRAAFGGSDAAHPPAVAVIVSSNRFPGGTGWQGLPAWLPQETTVWQSSASWVLPVPIASASPLR